jgi:hypothetical protein
MLGESSREFCTREFDREFWGEKRGRLGDRPRLTAAGARADTIRWIVGSSLKFRLLVLSVDGPGDEGP